MDNKKYIKNQLLFLRLKIIGLFFSSSLIALALFEGSRATKGISSDILYGLELLVGVLWLGSIISFVSSFEFGKNALNDLDLLNEQPDQYWKKYKKISSLFYYLTKR